MRRQKSATATDEEKIKSVVDSLRTREGFDEFLKRADKLRDTGTRKKPRFDQRIFAEVMNFRFTF